MNFKYFGLIVMPMLILGSIGVGVMIMTSAYWWLLLTFVFWVLMSGLGIATGFHRIYSHRTYELKPWLDNFILVCGTLACQSSSITWVATHIGYHHPHADTSKDPHTPIKGKLHALIGWVFGVNANTINHKYAVKLLRKPAHIYFHKNYFRIVWAFVVVLGLISWQALLFGYCIAAMISLVQDHSVNLFGHWPTLGYRNFETKDISSNFVPLGYFGWGQGWHNNHHYAPKEFDFGTPISGKWWEFDPCRIFIPLLKAGSIEKE